MTDVLSPWSSRAVLRLLDRYWELRHSSRVSNPGAIGGATDCDGREIMVTVSTWIEMIDKGCRKWFPKRRWGRRPVVISWLIAKDSAQERNVVAEESQHIALSSGVFKHKHVKDGLSRLWKRAEDASLKAHQIEHSRNFEIQVGWLSIAFSICAEDDWVFREMTYNRRPIDMGTQATDIRDEEGQ